MPDSIPLREQLKTHLASSFVRAPMKIGAQDEPWYLLEGIPSEPGWYLIETNAPLEIFNKQHMPQCDYITKTGKSASVKHYDLVSRSSVYSEVLVELFAGPIVYSGIASSLRDRAREHTRANWGTAALSLDNYPDLANSRYQWWFRYSTFSGFWSGPEINTKQRDIVLRLGEQIWRAHNGWPILCSG
jgi:hypothetical protein